MPLYSYICPNGHKFDFFARIKDFETTAKLICGFCREQAQRAPTAPAFHLKGEGWANDGYSSITKKTNEPESE